MKTYKELTRLAVLAQRNNESRANFLAGLEPTERSDAALQLDRAKKLAAWVEPTVEEIDEEAHRIAVSIRVISWLERHSQYHRHILKRMFIGYTGWQAMPPTVKGTLIKRMLMASSSHNRKLRMLAHRRLKIY
jgi:hypothetical protein